VDWAVVGGSGLLAKGVMMRPNRGVRAADSQKHVRFTAPLLLGRELDEKLFLHFLF